MNKLYQKKGLKDIAMMPTHIEGNKVMCFWFNVTSGHEPTPIGPEQITIDNFGEWYEYEDAQN